MLRPIANLLSSATVRFNTKENFSQEDLTLSQNIFQLVVYVVALIVLMLVGKFLWNDVLVQLVTFVKPMKHGWQVVGLYALLRLLFPSS